MNFLELLKFKFNLALADLSVGLITMLILIIGYGLILVYISIRDAIKVIIKKIKGRKKKK